jgi:Fe-S cluster assembly protein SufD
LIQPEIGLSLSEGDSPLALLALAEATPRRCVRLTPRNLKPQGDGHRPPVTIGLVAGGDHDGVSGVVRIDVPAGQKVRLIESHLSARACANVLVFLDVGVGAELERIQFCAGGAGAVIVSTAFVRLEESARLTQTSLSFGARLSRLETIVSHDGAGAVATLNGAYLLDRGSHSDFTTRVTHASRGCISRQKVKGACCPGAVAAFQGRYHILQSGQQADATMEHHGLLLGDGAEINAKPELEIYADDVRCAHGATTGRLDGDLLFYMRQRGLPESEARAILLESFLAEAFADADPASAARLDVVAREMLGRLA